MLKPLNDYALVEIIDENKASGLEIQAGQYDGSEKGTVLEVGNANYLSTNAWVKTLTNYDSTVDCYADIVGKVIYWEKFTDNNATIEKDGKKYAFIKLSKIVGYEEETK